MWSLVLTRQSPKTNCSPKEIRLLCNNEYSVGRKDSDILLVEDQSISRKHATLKIYFTQQDVLQPNCRPKLLVSDFSKFGTYVDDQKLSGGTVEVKSGSAIKFGQLHNSYRAEYKPMVISTSAVPPADKELLSGLLLQLGGHMVSDWMNSCSYLVMNRASITIKAICALSAGKMITKIDYFTQCLHAVQNNAEMPNPENYLPDMSDDSDNSLLKSNTNRQTVFKDRKFYFILKSQYDRMRMCIESASGSCLLLEKRPRSLSALVNYGSILMHSDGSNLPAWYNDAITYIQRRQLRCIQDAEVGHAILHCSTSDYCNPEMSAGERLYKHFTQQTSDQTQTSAISNGIEESQAVVLNTKKEEPDQQRIHETSIRSNKRTASVLEPETLAGEPVKRSRLGKRSLEGSEFLLPSDVSRVAESQLEQTVTTQNQVGNVTKSSRSLRTSKANDIKIDNVIENDETQHQSISNNRTQSDSKRLKPSVLVDETTHSSDYTNQDNTATHVQEKTTPIQERTNSRIDNTVDRLTCEETVNNTEAPSIPNIKTPERTTTDQDRHQIEDRSVIADSREKTTTGDDVISRSHIKREATEYDNDVSDILHQSVYNNTVKQELPSDLSEERYEQIGNDWDKVIVQYKELIRSNNTKTSRIEHYDGKTLWNGVWVKNYKKFKKTGCKTQSVLPQIIGGSDLYNGLGSQALTDVYNDLVTGSTDEPDHNANTPPVHIISSNNSIFGGAWELPV